MKRLLGLCVLLFAGHAMAACDVSLLHGSYYGQTSGTLPPGLSFSSIASAKVNGDGTGKAELWANVIGGLLPPGFIHLTNQDITYTVTDAQDGSGNCVFRIVAPFGVLQVPYIGVMKPDGSGKTLVITDLPGASIFGYVEKTN
jgi:hypothetical protein